MPDDFTPISDFTPLTDFAPVTAPKPKPKTLMAPEPPSMWQFFPQEVAKNVHRLAIEEGPSITGGIAGAKTGAAIGAGGGPWSAVGGAMLGGAFGALSGEEIKNLWQRYVEKNPNPDEASFWRKLLVAAGGMMEGVPLAAGAIYPEAAASARLGARVTGKAIQEGTKPAATVMLPAGAGKPGKVVTKTQFAPKKPRLALQSGAREMLPPQAEQPVVQPAAIAESTEFGKVTPNDFEALPTNRQFVLPDEAERFPDLYSGQPETAVISDIEDRLRTIYMQETRNPALTEQLLEAAKNGQLRDVVTKNAEESGLIKLLREQATKQPKAVERPSPWAFRERAEVVEPAIAPTEPGTMTTGARAESTLAQRVGETSADWNRTTAEMNNIDEAIQSEKTVLANMKKALDDTKKVHAQFPSIARRDRGLTSRLERQISRQEKTIQTLEDSKVQQTKQGFAPTGEIPPPVNASLPNPWNIAIQRAWRPTLDIIKRFAPEVSDRMSTAFHAGEQFQQETETLVRNTVQQLGKAVGSGNRKAALEALVHKLNGSPIEDVPEASRPFLQNSAVNDASIAMRRLLDEIKSYANRPEIRKVIGDSGYIENYFPWAKLGDDTDNALRAAVDETKQSFIRDPKAGGYKSPFLKPRGEGKIPNVDFEDVMRRYISSMRKTLFDVPAFDDAKTMATAYTGGLQPSNQKMHPLGRLISKYLDHYIGAPSTQLEEPLLNKLVDQVNANTYASTLGLPNWKTPLKNLNQLINTAVKAGPLNTAKGVVHFKRGVDELNKLGLLREAPGLEESALSHKSILNRARNAFMVGFQASEKFLRGSAYEAGKAKFAEESLEKATEGFERFFMSQQQRKAVELMGETQFQYGRLNPVFMTKNPFLKMVFVLNSYPFRMGSFVYDLVADVGRAATPADKAKALTALGAFVGLQAGASTVGAGAGSLLMGKSPMVQQYEKGSDIARKAIEATFDDTKKYPTKEAVMDFIRKTIALQTPGGATLERLTK